MWLVIDDGDAVTWCLDHGASPLAQGQRSWPDFDVNNMEEFYKRLKQHPWSDAERSDYFDCPPLLQCAARQSTVATFELLRSRGAAMSWRVLHKAVASAIYGPFLALRRWTRCEPVSFTIMEFGMDILGSLSGKVSPCYALTSNK